jgi:hypothetical protein
LRTGGVILTDANRARRHSMSQDPSDIDRERGDAAEADALDQATPVVADDDPLPTALDRGIEVPEADALDQAREVRFDEDDDG